MDMKINETTPVSQVEATAPKEKVDGDFKFTLTSKNRRVGIAGKA